MFSAFYFYTPQFACNLTTRNIVKLTKRNSNCQNEHKYWVLHLLWTSPQTFSEKQFRCNSFLYWMHFMIRSGSGVNLGEVGKLISAMSSDPATCLFPFFFSWSFYLSGVSAPHLYFQVFICFQGSCNIVLREFFSWILQPGVPGVS